MVIAIPTQTTVNVSWSFTTALDSRNETFIVMYGTTNGNLSEASPSIQNMPNVHQYSIELVSLLPGTRYYYQIYSTNKFGTRTGEEWNIKTMDASKFCQEYIMLKQRSAQHPVVTVETSISIIVVGVVT